MSNASYNPRLMNESKAEWEALDDRLVKRAAQFTFDIEGFCKDLAELKDNHAGITQWCKLVKSEGALFVCFFPRPGDIGGKAGGKFGVSLLVDHEHRNAWILRFHSPDEEFNEADEEKFARECLENWDGRKE